MGITNELREYAKNQYPCKYTEEITKQILHIAKRIDEKHKDELSTMIEPPKDSNGEIIDNQEYIIFPGEKLVNISALHLDYSLYSKKWYFRSTIENIVWHAEKCTIAKPPFDKTGKTIEPGTFVSRLNNFPRKVDKIRDIGNGKYGIKIGTTTFAWSTNKGTTENPNAAYFENWKIVSEPDTIEKVKSDYRMNKCTIDNFIKRVQEIALRDRS